jgi:peptidoglycan hydrolase-like protein with peptidoglycan-binding domain
LENREPRANILAWLGERLKEEQGMSSIGGLGNLGHPGDIHGLDAAGGDATSTAATLSSPVLAGDAKLAEIAGGDGSLARGATGASVKAVQTALAKLSFLDGPADADGVFGPKTQAAVAAYQKAENLRATGVVDGPTLVAIDARLSSAGTTTTTTTPSTSTTTPATTTTPGRPSLPTVNLPGIPGPLRPPARPTTPTLPPGAIDEVKSGKLDVIEGANSQYDLSKDTLTITGDGSWSSSINRDIYVAGYLPRTDGPLNSPIGTGATSSPLLSSADNQMNSGSPVKRFDEAMQRATGTAGKLDAQYAKEGKQPDAQPWWGFCDRWSDNALDPTIATHVNQPIQYQGMYFSTAELRGLATFMGRADENTAKDLFKKDVSPLDLEKAATLFLHTNGSGFVSSIWNNSKHPGDYQVWNQPFDSVDQKMTELKGDDAAKVLKEQFNLTGDAAKGKHVYLADTVGHYGEEQGDDYEGPAGADQHGTKDWKSWILTDDTGKAIDGKWTPDSDDPPEYIWRPDRSAKLSPEASFFRQLLTQGVPDTQVASFEKAIAALPANKAVDAATKASLVKQFAGVAAAYSPADLTTKLKPLGLTAADFK